MPSPSLNWMSMDCGSWGEVRTSMPPAACWVLMMKRLTGMGDISRSETLTPVALSPVMMARLMVRACREASRLVTTWELRGRMEP